MLYVQALLHSTYQLNLSHFSPPSILSLGIAVWSISTMTCVRAVSFPGALPRATSSTTPWWSTVHRWGSSTRTHWNTHSSHMLVHLNESTHIHTYRLWLLQQHIYTDFQFEFVTLHWMHADVLIHKYAVFLWSRLDHLTSIWTTLLSSAIFKKCFFILSDHWRLADSLHSDISKVHGSVIKWG